LLTINWQSFSERLEELPMSKLIARGSLAVLYVSLASPAFAYLDGATGSMILQAMIGGVATAMVFGRMYIAKAKAFLFRGSKTPSGKGE
jgi:hypothetical protein